MEGSMLHRGASGTYGAPDLSHCCTTHTEREAFYFHLLIQKKEKKSFLQVTG